MKALVIHEFGDVNIFKLEDVSKPKIKSGHLLIKVQATSVNPIDCKIREGKVPAVSPAFPAILHGDVAGTVVEIGSDVTNFKVGDEIYAYAGGAKGCGGALAEFMLVDACLAAQKPVALSFTSTAALPIVAITAWQALFAKANLKAGQSVLIHGGRGGVGHIAVQLARLAGAKVYATVREDTDIEIVKLLGADHVINSRYETVDDYLTKYTAGKGFNVVFDTVGGPNLDNSLQAAALNGTVVTTAARSTHDLTPMHNKALSLHVVFVLNPLITGIHREEYGPILTKITKYVDNKQLQVLTDPKEFKISEASIAHKYLESGLAKGKVVLSQDLS